MQFHLVRIFGLIACSAIIGCGSGNAPMMDQPVSVSGRVVDSDGKPIGNVSLTLQPLESGYQKSVDLKADGTFTVEAHPGKYAYYFGPKSGSKSPPANLSKFLEANMDRTVALAPGSSLEIKLP